MDKDKKKMIFTIVAIIQVIVILTLSISYAWFADKANPSISQDNMKVSSAEGLVIKLNPDSVARTNVNLSELLSDWDSFELNQLSSADGTDFYGIDFGAGLSHNLPSYFLIEPDEVTGTLEMERNGCIDYNFYFSTENFAKHVYFHKDTHITGLAANSIRVAISVTQNNVTTTRIFGTVKEDGSSSNPYTTNAVNGAGTFDYSEASNELTTNQNVFAFSDFGGGRTTDDNNPIDLSKTLFSMNSFSTTKVNIKIWLEGGDEECDNDLANSSLDLLLKFGSANILRDAPSVSVNNALKIINNLTTEMEYAFTNNSTSIWTRVTNPNMTFASGNTVYVRYSEVEGVSPYSYVTTVTFN